MSPVLTAGATTFVRSRWLFLRLLALVYLIAFASLGAQITGLVGDHGILPIGELLARAQGVHGWQAYRLFPTLVWLSPHDAMLSFLCWCGAAVSLLLMAGVAPMALLILLWVFYLSLTVAGQVFLEFQWDALLLETGLVAVLYAPRSWRSRVSTDPEPSGIARWLVWGLAFKLTFLAGITKILSGDPTWADLTAMTYHYETTPLPAWTGWLVHQLPASLHRWSAAAMFVIELVVPWLIFLPARFRRLRLAACLLMTLLQLVIGLTGNYGFFNILTTVLYLAMLDDRTLGGVPGLRAPSRTTMPTAAGAPAASPLALRLCALTLGALSVLALVREIDRTAGRAQPTLGVWSNRGLAWVAPFRSTNGYGLFRVMTTERREIVIEVSADGARWEEYHLRWKPGDVMRKPGFVQPHMPRLDWQMWFAALDPRGEQFWLEPLLQRLLAGDADVTRLLGPSPLDGPPHFARLAWFSYRFSTPGEREQSGAWWRREFIGYLIDARR